MTLEERLQVETDPWKASGEGFSTKNETRCTPMRSGTGRVMGWRPSLVGWKQCSKEQEGHVQDAVFSLRVEQVGDRQVEQLLCGALQSLPEHLAGE